MSQIEPDKTKDSDCIDLINDTECYKPSKLFDSSADTSASLTPAVSPLQRNGFSDSSEDESGCGDESANKGGEPLGPGEEQAAGPQQYSPSSDSLPTPAQRYPAGHSSQSPPIMQPTSGVSIKPSTSRPVSPNPESLPTPAQRYPAGHISPTMHLTSGDSIKPSTSQPVSPISENTGSQALPPPGQHLPPDHPSPKQSPITPTTSGEITKTGTHSGTEIHGTSTPVSMFQHIHPHPSPESDRDVSFPAETPLGQGNTPKHGTRGAPSSTKRSLFRNEGEPLGTEDDDGDAAYLSRSEPAFEEQVEEPVQLTGTQQTASDFIFMTFSLLQRNFINLNLKTKICNAFFQHIGTANIRIDTSLNTEITFRVPQYLYAKAEEFLNQSSNLPTLKLVNKPKQQSKPQLKADVKKKSISKGVVNINGENETQFKAAFNFKANQISHYQPIFNRWGKSTGKAILTFDACEPPLFIQGAGQEKTVSPLLYKPVRCNNCQDLGHRGAICKKSKPRCINCDGDHAAEKCHWDFYRVPFNCHNCKGNHTANFAGCPAWLRYKHEINLKNKDLTKAWNNRKLNAQLQQENQVNSTSAQPTQYRQSTSTKSYAQTVSSQPPSTYATSVTPAPPNPTHIGNHPPQTRTTPGPKPDNPVELVLPTILEGQLPKNKFIQTQQVATILKFLFRPGHIAALQAMSENKRDEYIEHLSGTPEVFIGTEEAPIIIDSEAASFSARPYLDPSSGSNPPISEPTPEVPLPLTEEEDVIMVGVEDPKPAPPMMQNVNHTETISQMVDRLIENTIENNDTVITKETDLQSGGHLATTYEGQTTFPTLNDALMHKTFKVGQTPCRRAESRGSKIGRGNSQKQSARSRKQLKDKEFKQEFKQQTLANYTSPDYGTDIIPPHLNRAQGITRSAKKRQMYASASFKC